MNVQLRAAVWRYVCSAQGHRYEAPTTVAPSGQWMLLRSEATSLLAAYPLTDPDDPTASINPFVRQVYDAVTQVTASWHARSSDSRALGADAFAVAFDPSPDGSGYRRGGMANCPIDNSEPSSYGPFEPEQRWADITVPVATHEWWDHASEDDRRERIRARVEYGLATIDTFRNTLRPGLAEIAAERYLREALEPATGESLAITSRRRFQTEVNIPRGEHGTGRYVFGYTSRSGDEGSDRQSALARSGLLIVDRETREITIANPEIPVENQVAGTERDFYTGSELRSQVRGDNTDVSTRSTLSGGVAGGALSGGVAGGSVRAGPNNPAPHEPANLSGGASTPSWGSSVDWEPRRSREILRLLTFMPLWVATLTPTLAFLVGLWVGHPGPLTAAVVLAGTAASVGFAVWWWRRHLTAPDRRRFLSGDARSVLVVVGLLWLSLTTAGLVFLTATPSVALWTPSRAAASSATPSYRLADMVGLYAVAFTGAGVVGAIVMGIRMLIIRAAEGLGIGTDD